MALHFMSGLSLARKRMCYATVCAAVCLACVAVAQAAASKKTAPKSREAPAKTEKPDKAVKEKEKKKEDNSAKVDGEQTPPKAKPAGKRALEPVCVTLEPAVLRTGASQPLAGARATVLSPAKETADGLKLLTAEELKAAGLSWEQFLEKAKAAASRHLKTLEPAYTNDKRGEALYAKVTSESHLTASVILCPEFRERFSRTLGNDLVVIVPDRFTIFVFARKMGEFQKMGSEVAEIFARAVYQGSNEVFEITPDHFRSIGSFGTGGQDEP